MPTNKESRQRQAIPRRLIGKTDDEVAEEIGVSRQTIWKWRRQEDFDHDIVEAGEALRAAQNVAILELFKKSVSSMSELLECSDDNLKFKAALTVLNAANEWGYPVAPGHMDGWEKQFVAQGGKSEDFLTALLTGTFDPRAEMRAKIEGMTGAGRPDFDSKPDGSEEKQ